MSDTDFLLMPVLSDYFQTQAGRRRMEAFLARNSTLVPGSFDELVNRNREHIVNLTTDFPYSVHGRIGDLVGSRAYPIGNWRDSLAGLGWGNYPFDLNCGPAAPLLHWPQPRDGNLKEGYPYVPFPGPSHLGNKPRGARRLFEVTITPEETEASLARYVDRANLSSSLLYGAGALNSTFTLSEGWNSPNQTIGRNGNSTFYALSIDAKEWVEDGRRIISSVNVLNSDLSFVLAYDTVASSPNQIRATVEAMQPYPRGLLTNVGMVVANAAYDPNTTNIDVFSNRAYHGAVAWSWQQALMAAGLSKQLASCSSWGPAREGESSWFNQQFCQDSALVESLKQAETRLWDSIAGSESVLYTEVWSPVFNATTNKFDIGDLGAISPEGTEGNAFQLWSYAFLGLVDPRTGRPVAAGFVPPSAL
ncbi:hypothetical protein Q8F55_004576 [Vanrija albida]|uniref:Uncharacterized protein n=1 Tax=Vanrija albida TaxID=181172 RepID=A0ABR3Q7B6_9TREE